MAVNKVTRCVVCLALLLLFATAAVHAQNEAAQHGTLLGTGADLDGIEIETIPCGNFDDLKDAKLLDKDIVAFYFLKEGKVRYIRVRPTCHYHERHMPKTGEPSMSKNKFETLLKVLDAQKSLGRFVGDSGVVISMAHFESHTRQYENGRVSWDELNCTNRKSKFGCGIIRVDVAYKN